MKTKKNVINVSPTRYLPPLLSTGITTTCDFDKEVLEHIINELAYLQYNTFTMPKILKYHTGDIHRIRRSFKKLGKIYVYLAKHIKKLPNNLHINFISRKPKIFYKKSFFKVDKKDTFLGETNKKLLVTLNGSSDKKDYVKIEIVFK